jgi:hypothetical protein
MQKNLRGWLFSHYATPINITSHNWALILNALIFVYKNGRIDYVPKETLSTSSIILERIWSLECQYYKPAKYVRWRY